MYVSIEIFFKSYGNQIFARQIVINGCRRYIYFMKNTILQNVRNIL